ncbi:MAG: hypothetical protein QGI18_10095 [Candidatus Marinimicrobia bacterium]|jgi:hypothetical protein|nr:hypothetical protein [Candidatus Neomarinimicrobiota bacterium]
MTTLLEKLRPEIVDALEKSRADYDYSITGLYDKLDNLHLYSQVDVGTIRDLILYADVNDKEWDLIDWKYGDKLFKQELVELA